MCFYKDCTKSPLRRTMTAELIHSEVKTLFSCTKLIKRFKNDYFLIFIHNNRQQTVFHLKYHL